jgi:deoxyribodipyrimidine photo-lyase
MNNKINIFIFRRDLRLFDNIGLINTLENYKNILPIFIGTPEQLDNNEYKSDFAVQFLCESLCELSDEFKNINKKLYCFFGDNLKILQKLIEEYKVESINFNKDYTPYAIKRDNDIIKLCDTHGVKCNLFDDYLLAPPSNILTKANTPYKVYGQFRKKEIELKIDVPVDVNKNDLNNLLKRKVNIKDFKVYDSIFLKDYYKENNNINIHGGRKNAIKILNNMNAFKNYSKERDNLTYETTNLSAYIKFGCISIREVYHAFKNDTLINQLIWRDFYYHILFYFPNNLKNSMKSKFDNFKWINNKEQFKNWCDGKTGYPVVDAAMRQLNKIGYMHNRGRLITSNFLTKILICNWKWGEKYYAQHLIDYDPAVNNGNWQWSAGTGTDTAPYSQRIFNPWIQSSKFDPKCIYIKKWIPELKDIPEKDIHNWENSYKKYNLDELKYPKPIVNYKIQRELVKKIYKSID